MRVEIVGMGVVGRATWHNLRPGIEKGASDLNLDRLVGYDIAEGGFWDLSFICVPTPLGLDGQLNTRMVKEAMHSAKSPNIVIRSTVPVGFTRSSGALAYLPCFAREAHAMTDERDEPRIVVGTFADGEAIANLLAPRFCQVFVVAPEVAEMAKLANNAFLTLSIAFANEMAEACGDIPWTQVADILRADRRIGPDAYLDARGTWGGACLPKDVQHLLNQFHMQDSLLGRAESQRASVVS